MRFLYHGFFSPKVLAVSLHFFCTTGHLYRFGVAYSTVKSTWYHTNSCRCPVSDVIVVILWKIMLYSYNRWEEGCAQLIGVKSIHTAPYCFERQIHYSCFSYATVWMYMNKFLLNRKLQPVYCLVQSLIPPL